jgi:ribosome-associated toxin RatA of RatAB toxin-antitoxin module
LNKIGIVERCPSDNLFGMKSPGLDDRLSSENHPHRSALPRFWSILLPHLFHRSNLAKTMLCIVALLTPLQTFAGTKNAAPLLVFPPAKVRALAPMLRSSDITLIESEPSGQMKQISIFTLVAAPPTKVRETLLDAARYIDIVRNFKVSRVTPTADGSFDHYYELSYGLFSVDGANHYVQFPADPNSDAPPVEIIDTDDGPGGTRHYRWEFYGVAGATVVAMYGFTNVRHSGGLVAKLFQRVPQLEHGMALVSQATLAFSVKQRSEQLQGAPPLLPPAGNASYDFLLERGVVVLMRSQSGRLSELSMIDNSSAPPAVIGERIKQVRDWSSFVPTITKSEPSGSHDDFSQYELEQSLPLLSFRTSYGTRTFANPSGGTIDMMGISGDLKGSRMRWDVTPGRGAASQVLLRSSLQFDRGSIIMRQIYKAEPLFEYGVNVGLQLVILRGIKLRSEQHS